MNCRVALLLCLALSTFAAVLACLLPSERGERPEKPAPVVIPSAPLWQPGSIELPDMGVEVNPYPTIMGADYHAGVTDGLGQCGTGPGRGPRVLPHAGLGALSLLRNRRDPTQGMARHAAYLRAPFSGRFVFAAVGEELPTVHLYRDCVLQPQAEGEGDGRNYAVGTPFEVKGGERYAITVTLPLDAENAPPRFALLIGEITEDGTHYELFRTDFAEPADLEALNALLREAELPGCPQAYTPDTPVWQDMEGG